MDWTQLRVLSFGPQPVTSMLPHASLSGHFPQLNSLTVIIANYHDPDMQDPACAIPIFITFLRSTTALKKLRMRWKFLLDCLSMILHLQGHSLREIHLSYVGDHGPWDHSQCINVLSKAPKLSHLLVYTYKRPDPPKI
jgi:hypothetical protein